MRGRDYLNIARELLLGVTEGHWRAASGRAYYALFLEVGEAMTRWGFLPSKADNVHAYFRLRLMYAADPDAVRIGRNLEWLLERRTKADYDLMSPLFAVDAVAREAITRAEQALVLLNAAPARRAAVVAAIRARWP